MKSKKLTETGGFEGINKPYSGVDKYQSVPTKNVQIDNIIEDLLTLEDSIEQTNTNISNLSKENIAGLQLDDSPEFRKVVLRTTTKDSSTNAIEVYDSDGTLIFSTDSRGFSTKIFYRDEYVGGPWTEASGAAAPDLVNYTIGGIATRKYSFDGVNIEERLSNSFEIPHDIALDQINAETERIEVHIHWMPSTTGSGNVKWFFDYTYIPVNAAPIVQTALSVVVTVSSNQQYFHKINSFQGAGAILSLPKPSSGFNIGDIIEFNLRRTPTDNDDTYAADAILIKVALHVPCNSPGSRQRYVK